MCNSYIDFDSWDDTKAIGTSIVTHDNKQYQRISYIVNEAVPLKNQKLKVDYHFASDQEKGKPLKEKTDDGNEKASKYYVLLQQPITDELVTYSAETGEAAGELLVGKEYYVDIPISVLNGKDGVQFVFRARINYGRLKDQYVYDYKKVYLLRRGLYDLD